MPNLFNPPKFASGCLVGIDSNIYSVVGYFSKVAQRSGWKQEEITKVVQAVTSSTSYEMALGIVANHIASDLKQPQVVELNIPKKSKSEISDLFDKVAELNEKFDNESNTIDENSDYKNKIKETSHGEMVSALEFIAYEYYNNGYFFYGADSNNTGAHAEYLIRVCPTEINELILNTAKQANFNEDDYEQFLGRLAELVLNTIETTEDSKNEYPNHYVSFSGRWEYNFHDCCGEVTEGHDCCSCEDEDE
jgi:hypothetical protein